MKAVVLAAGEGVRLKPITSTRPKHLIKVAGIPILEKCLKEIKESGIDEVLIVVHFMADAICRHFQEGTSLGLKIEYVKQEGILGTGNAICLAEPYVKDDFLVVYGDLLFNTDAIRRVIRLHGEKRTDVVMTIVPVEHPENYGIVELEDEGDVKRLVEKPSRDDSSSNMANAGIYVFSTGIFEEIKKTKASARGEWEITDAISQLLVKGKNVLTVEIPKESWFDIGRPWDLLEANRWALMNMKHKICGCVESDAHLVGPVTVAETAYIRSGAYVEGPTIIDEESDIGPNCYIRPYTSIGRKVRIGNACEVKNSIIMDNTHIGHLSYIGDTIVGQNCNLGAGTVTANLRLDDKNIKMSVKDVMVDSGRRKLGAVLGDGVKSGINALFMPGIKVGCNSWIGPNVVVERDLAADKILLLKQTLEERNLEK
ncbi:MAG: sugar phosphate nucleotidyltransferase [Candidatus Bathyarchaeota archaeon]|jgi:bifunctional UDP-N-acetylglucosamine pyrophosphorylase/glucosamine-1-phosphate N-acetyltransferase